MKLFLLLLAGTFVFGADESPSVAAARRQWELVRQQVAQGLVPASKLAEAQTAIDDAADEAILDGTLYGKLRVEDLNPAQATEMLEAAGRRVDRTQKQLDRAETAIANALAAPHYDDELKAELARRKEVLRLAKERSALVESILNMATVEAAPAEDKEVEEIYRGDGALAPQDIKEITLAFEKKFDKPLPVSARGETAVHRALGLDHTGRIDVALAPDSTEGVWLRHYLESKDIPYYAFRAAIPGKATAPHIHIGPGSTRLRVTD